MLPNFADYISTKNGTCTYELSDDRLIKTHIVRWSIWSMKQQLWIIKLIHFNLKLNHFLFLAIWNAFLIWNIAVFHLVLLLSTTAILINSGSILFIIFLIFISFKDIYIPYNFFPIFYAVSSMLLNYHPLHYRVLFH